MKLNRTGIFIIISSIALVTVLIIQVNWIVQSAKIKEDLFNEKAEMVLTRTSEALGSDTVTCKNIGDCIGDDNGSVQSCRLGKVEVNKIDSLLKHYMNVYNFHLDYSFKVMKPMPFNVIPKNQVNYMKPVEPVNHKKSLEEMASENGFELNLILPKKENYIRAEMGPMFLSSVILILIVLVLFWRTIYSLINEKKISEHTTDFLNNMTHEFKTPLTNIGLAGKMIMKDPAFKQGDKINQYTGIILEENEKLRLQVEQVLNMTALDRGEIPLHKTDFNFHELIQNSVKNMSMQIENVQGHLVLNLNAERVEFNGDKIHLANAVDNLVDNAIKYSNGKPEISIETRNMGQHLEIIVSDKGIGIGKEYQKKVFNKFFRIPTGDIHNIKGFGLGLAYVKKIIEMHGGTIELYSEKGTQFTIRFPNV